MTRNILDKDGNIIGTLTLDDSTPEDVWTARLADYLGPPAPPEPTPEQLAKQAMDFGMDIIAQIGAESEVNSLTTDQMVQLIQLGGPIQLMLMTGAIGTALITMQNTDFTGILPADLVQKYVSLLQAYLGVSS